MIRENGDFGSKKNKLRNFLNAHVTVKASLSIVGQAICVDVNLELAKAIDFSLLSCAH